MPKIDVLYDERSGLWQLWINDKMIRGDFSSEHNAWEFYDRMDDDDPALIRSE